MIILRIKFGLSKVIFGRGTNLNFDYIKIIIVIIIIIITIVLYFQLYQQIITRCSLYKNIDGIIITLVPTDKNRMIGAMYCYFIIQY